VKAGTLGRSVGAVCAAVLLLGAALLWQQMPDKLQSWGPIPVRANVGERAEGRNLAVTVHSTRLAREVTFGSGDDVKMLPGFWVVSIVSYESLAEPARPRFGLEALGRTYSTSLNGFEMLTDTQPGFIQRSVLAFETPEFPAVATLVVKNVSRDRFGNDVNAPLDSEIRIGLSWEGEPARSVDLDTAAEAGS